MLRALNSADNFSRLSPGEVHVWCVRLISDADAQSTFDVLYESHPWDAPLRNQPIGYSNPFLADLSEDECDRAGRFVFELDRVRYIAARGILRRLLGGYLNIDPAEIRFSYGACGKPELAGLFAERLRFNISHAGNWAVYAISGGREVGIDIELLRNDIPWQQLASLVFSPNEQAEFAEIPLHEKATAFLRGWTRKEAYVKGRGEGLSLALESFDVPLGPLMVPGRVRSALTAKVVPGEWWLYPVTLSEDVVATLAVEGPPVRFEVHRWCHARFADTLNPLKANEPQRSRNGLPAMDSRSSLHRFSPGASVNPDAFGVCTQALRRSNLHRVS